MVSERNAARTLDLDLLLYGRDPIEEPGLQVPHPRMRERAFVLEPLCDVAPEWIHPLANEATSRPGDVGPAAAEVVDDGHLTRQQDRNADDERQDPE